MVPDKFNMVDMEGIDILFRYGDIIPGLYQKLVESIAQCRYQCLYNWYFDGVLIPPTYVEMVVNQDTNDIWINDGVFVTSDDRMSLHLPSLETTSGSIVHITDALSRKVEELICYINPLQSGSGDPSPNNIRPISGFLAVNIYDEEEYDSSTAPKLTINWQTEAGIIYGGTVTLNEDGSADAVITMVGLDLGTKTWTKTTSGFYTEQTGMKTPANTDTWLPNWYCSNYKVENYNNLSADNCIYCLNKTQIRIKDSRYADADTATFKTAMSGVQLVYELATYSAPIHLENIGELYTYLGTNTIWHDANGDISVTYWKE